MKRLTISTVALMAILGSLSSVNAAPSTFNIISNIKFSGEIRPRYEYANKVDGAEAANSFTARTRFAIEGTLLGIDGLSTKIGLTSVNNFGYENYNDGSATGNTKYEKIVDAQQAMVSEAYLTYTITDTTLLAGRSHINLDDQRFIGTVGWRQMERAYDTLTVVNKSVKGLTLLGSYIYGYQGVNSNPTTETTSVLLNLNYKLNEMVVLTGFSYLLADVHDTYGLRVTGKAPVNDIKLNYAVSYAQQSKASIDFRGGANAEIDASYIDVALSANINGVIAGVEYEKLSKANGSSTKGFTTPLSTLHKFQGFADEFLAQTGGSNNKGLRDMSIKTGYVTKSTGKALVIYHKFFAESGTGINDNKDLGSEIDALYTNKISGLKGVSGLLKMGYYMAGDTGLGHDKDKIVAWAQIDYKF
ncbi:MAG: hypothetical protein Q9M34_12000 [Sulfurimonas sp.]|nr:hypothetical protein [Sulfurimonas sp.]